MKIHLIKPSLFIVLAGCTILCCNKNNSGPPTPRTPPKAGGTILDREVWYDSTSQSTMATFVYTYNADGDVTDISSVGGSFPNGDTMTYQSPGHLLIYNSHGILWTKMIYDSTGQIIKTADLIQSQTLKAGFTYDSKGRIITDTIYGDNGIRWYNIYQYDDSDNMTRYESFFRDDSTNNFHTWGPTVVTYDHHPNPHYKFGKVYFYGNGDYTYLFKENPVSEMRGTYDMSLTKGLTYEYYAEGLLWRASTATGHLSITYYYK